MRRIEFLFRETASGLRRNGMIAFAAMSTAFIALFLFGLALVIQRQFSLITEATTGNVEVSVYLTDPVNPDTEAHLEQVLRELPAVQDTQYWNKQKTCDNYKVLFANNPAFLENVDCEATIPTSIRVKLTDPKLFEQVPARLGCAPDPDTNEITCSEPGVKEVKDFSQLLDTLVSITRVLSIAVLSVAALMLISAVALVANTLRMGLFARRKEIGIMRLVGATNWRIRIPFMIEGLVESLLGGIAAVCALFIVKVFAIDRLRGHFRFVPFIRNSDLLGIAPIILLVAVVIAVIAGTVGMRRFLDV